jgi:hypothetical protein
MHTEKLAHLKGLMNFSVSSRTRIYKGHQQANDNPDESEKQVEEKHTNDRDNRTAGGTVSLIP